MPATTRRKTFAPLNHIAWKGDHLLVLDQRELPRRSVYLQCRSAVEVAEAIRSMALRGAPLIGCAAAYGMALAAKGGSREMAKAAPVLLKARPTAVNLAHAVEAMLRIGSARPTAGFFAAMERAAQDYFETDLEANRRMGELGASLLKKGSVVMTYCNAGALATAGLGTALGVIRAAHKRGLIARVYPCETRPYLQGSRLTLWELMQENIPATLITDNAAAHIMKTRKVDAVIVGSDRIAANADVCNKIGTYALAIAARHHGVPFYVAAPTSTVDLGTPNGAAIPIEERSAREVLEIGGKPIAPEGAEALHPAFDVTPAALVSAIVTEKGIIRPVNGRTLRKVVKTR